ncbi:MAG: M3 family metallopeptidase [Kineosporiaceae bacterium]
MSTDAAAPTRTSDLPADNPFASPSALPYGLPPFDRIQPEHYLPAFEAGMAGQRREVEEIASDPADPTIENTLEALERSGELLTRVSATFFNLTSSAVTDELAGLEADLAPAMAAHHDAIVLDRRLFARIATLRARERELGLDAEQSRLLERYHKDFVRAGAGLDERAQDRLREINAELSALSTEFKAKLLAETNDLAVHVTDEAELAGMSPDAIGTARAAAAERGVDGYLITLVLPTSQPALATLRRRDVRERLYRASVSRGLRGNADDTRATVVRIAALRAERAALLGFPTHADYAVADQTARTGEAVTSMLAALVGPAVENAHQEAAELEDLLEADGEPGPLKPWDWAYYAERVRRERFDVDAAALRPWFRLEDVVEHGVFHAAYELYGLRFRRRHHLPVYHRDVTVYEVFDDEDNAIGLFLADWYARPSKRGGAWMSTFVDQAHLLGTSTVAVVNLNIPRPAGGEPTLLTLDEVDTAFHEFGHVLHGMLSDVRYPRLSGTNVPRDFVEYPSQVNEMWALWPEVLRNYAHHHETGAPLADDVPERIRAAGAYGQGFALTEYLAATLLDWEWHRLAPGTAPDADGVEAFEEAALARHGLAFHLVPPRYRSTYFSHIFAGGYSAGYYSYVWSEVLDADTVEWFREHGGLRRQLGERFAQRLLSRGGAVDPMAAYESVLGRPPRVEPLLERRGLTPVS